MRVLRACETPLHQHLFKTESALAGATCWVAGGALRDWVGRHARKDIDVFFASEKLAYGAVHSMLDDAKLGAQVVEKNESVIRLDTDVGRVDLVLKRYFDTALEVVDRFDFTACACAVDVTGKLTHHVDFEDDAPAKRLVINALPTPVASLWRVHRLKARDWTMALDEYQNVIRRAVEAPEAGGWLSGDAPAKGMPSWAHHAWQALDDTADEPKLVAVLRRGVWDEAWTNEIESVALLASGHSQTNPNLPFGSNLIRADDSKFAARAAVREFIVSTVFNA